MTPHAPENAAMPEFEKLVAPQAAPRKHTVVYSNIVVYLYLHIAGFYGLYQCFTTAKWQTIFLAYIWYSMGVLGITAGAHRLWSHRSYKVKKPLEILLMLFQCIANQNSIMNWVRDHRLHHKYSDTDGDPYNSARGFFYSHVGWLLVKKSEDVKRRGLAIPLEDIYRNPVLQFQKKYKIPLLWTFCFFLPTLVPVFCWGETLSASWNISVLRYILNLNAVLFINSVAHKFGNKPYDKEICPTQSIIASIWTYGEGFHNYHHAFPWDYRAAELGNNFLNPTTLFIDFFTKIGWAYDLKTTSDDMIKKKKARSGDGTDSWGWGDDMTKEERDSATIMFPEKRQFLGMAPHKDVAIEDRDSAKVASPK